MKVLQLPDVLHEYLVHVIEHHAASGIHPEEGLALSKLWEAATKQVTHIPDEQIAKMAAAGSAGGQSVPTVVAEHQELETLVEKGVRDRVYNVAGVPVPPVAQPEEEQ